MLVCCYGSKSQNLKKIYITLLSTINFSFYKIISLYNTFERLLEMKNGKFFGLLPQTILWLIIWKIVRQENKNLDYDKIKC